MKLDRAELRSLILKEILSNSKEPKKINEEKLLTSGIVKLIAADDKETINEVITLALKHTGKISFGSTIASGILSELGDCAYADLGTTKEAVTEAMHALTTAMGKALRYWWLNGPQGPNNRLDTGWDDPNFGTDMDSGGTVPGPECPDNFKEVCEKWGINCGEGSSSPPDSYPEGTSENDVYDGTGCDERFLDSDTMSMCRECDTESLGFDEFGDPIFDENCDYDPDPLPTRVPGIEFNSEKLEWYPLPGWTWSESGNFRELRYTDEPISWDRIGAGGTSLVPPEASDVKPRFDGHQFDGDDYNITNCLNTSEPNELAVALYKISNGEWSTDFYEMLLYDDVTKRIFENEFRRVRPASSADTVQQNAIDLVAMLTFNPRKPSAAAAEALELAGRMAYEIKRANVINYERANAYVSQCPIVHACCEEDRMWSGEAWDGEPYADTFFENCFDTFEAFEEGCWSGGRDGGFTVEDWYSSADDGGYVVSRRRHLGAASSRSEEEQLIALGMLEPPDDYYEQDDDYYEQDIQSCWTYDEGVTQPPASFLSWRGSVEGAGIINTVGILFGADDQRSYDGDLVEEEHLHGANDMCIQILKGGPSSESLEEIESNPPPTFNELLEAPPHNSPLLGRLAGAYQGLSALEPSTTGEFLSIEGVRTLYFIWNTVGFGMGCGFVRANIPGGPGDVNPEASIRDMDQLPSHFGTWRDYINKESIFGEIDDMPETFFGSEQD